MNTLKRNPATNRRPLRTGIRHAQRPLSLPLTELRHRIQREFALRVPGSERVLAAALREAEAIAWQTGFPHLLFPLLAEEKARITQEWHIRQQSLRQQSAMFALAE